MMIEGRDLNLEVTRRTKLVEIKETSAEGLRWAWESMLQVLAMELFDGRRGKRTTSGFEREEEGKPVKGNGFCVLQVEGIEIQAGCGGITSDFSITIRLHQGSALSLFLFAIVMYELTRAIQDEIP